VVQHDHKRSQIHLLLHGIETQSGANLRSDLLIDDGLARLNTFCNKETPWSFHLAVSAEILRVRRRVGRTHGAAVYRNRESD